MRHASKSNRAAANYSELRLIEDLCKHFKLSFPYVDQLKNEKNKLKQQVLGEEKKHFQDQYISKLVEGCLVAYKKQVGNKKVKKIEWVGNQKKTTPEDIIIHVVDGEKVCISLKLVNSGKGTLKNAGTRTILTLGCDYREQVQKMKTEVKKAFIKAGYGKESSSASEIKSMARSNESLEQLASSVASPILEKINDQIFQSMKNLPKEKLAEFISSKIFGSRKEDVWEVCVSEGNLTVSNQSKDNKISSKDLITLGEKTDCGFKILKNGKPWLRANTCCTNGKGLSAICQRYFFA